MKYAARVRGNILRFVWTVFIAFNCIVINI